MIECGYGKIINLSSTWCSSTDAGKGVYGIAKVAVSYMSAALSTEWAPLGAPVSDFITGHSLFVDGGWHAAG